MLLTQEKGIMEVSQLTDKYNIDRSQLQARINFLGLKPIKTLKSSPFLRPREVFLLDDLHAHLIREGKFSNYIPPSFETIAHSVQEHDFIEGNSLEFQDRELDQTESAQKVNSQSEIYASKTELLPKIEEEITKTDNCGLEEGRSLAEALRGQPEGLEVSDRKLREVESYSFLPDAISKEIEEYFAFNQRLKYNGILEELASRGWGLTAKEIKELIGTKPNKNYYQYDCFMFVKQGKIGNQITWRVIKQPLEDFVEKRNLKTIEEQDNYAALKQEISAAEQDFLEDLKSIESNCLEEFLQA